MTTVMICSRCDRAIAPGEPYEDQLRHSASGPGITLHRHGTCPDEVSGADRDPAALEAARYAAWCRLLTHLGACPECLSDGPWGCGTGRDLRRAWRVAERDAR
ncbi:hypothetical protein [Streptomyces uncialis]|uniref:hypothetical protein n=1 Tax=Streptomyces uncialis TaxID=1048205 RepID=UPI00386ABC90|nr:hypothetical protein OG924_10735 [Streptomyces uncialis]